MSSRLEPSSEIEIQERDIELLRGLFESRVMTLAHAAALHFSGSKEAAKKRVQKLKGAGLIAERGRRPRDPSILHLTAKGIAILGDRGVISNYYPSFSRPYLEKRARVADSTLRHELQVMDVKAALVASIRAARDLELQTFTTWPLLNEFVAHAPDGERVNVKPDGFLVFLERDKEGEAPYRYFLEVDRGSESQDRLANHAWCYRDYYRSGGFAERVGGSREKPHEEPFRVLFVFETAERRNNAAERMLMLTQPVGSQMCLSTIREVLESPLGTIWITPKQYHEVTQGTPFDIERRRNLFGYVRSARREKLIEDHTQKFSLLE